MPRRLAALAAPSFKDSPGDVCVPGGASGAAACVDSSGAPGGEYGVVHDDSDVWNSGTE